MKKKTPAKKPKVIVRKKPIASFTIDQKLLNKFRKTAAKKDESMSGVICKAVTRYVGA